MEDLHCSSLSLCWIIFVLCSFSRISDYMDLTPVDIVGRRCYQFIHAEDVEGIRQSHLDCKSHDLVFTQPITNLKCSPNTVSLISSQTQTLLRLLGSASLWTLNLRILPFSPHFGITFSGMLGRFLEMIGVYWMSEGNPVISTAT